MNKYNSYQELSGHVIKVSDQDTIEDVKMKCYERYYHPHEIEFFEFNGVELLRAKYSYEEGYFDRIWIIVSETEQDKQFREKEQEKARKYEENLAKRREETESKKLKETIKKLKAKGYIVEQKIK